MLLLYNNCSGFSPTEIQSLNSSSSIPSGTTATPTPVASATPAPMPMPMPMPMGGWVLASSITPIDTADFNPANGKSKSALPPTNAPDVVGAFRFICSPGHLLADDPIVFPNQPGKSHLHQFYGNLGTNAHSTYASQRASGDSTCSGPNYPLNRSGYWMPAMQDGLGNAIRPNYLTVYYKRYPKNHIACTDSRFSSGCAAIPDGLRMIAGTDMANPNGPTQKDVTWECATANGSGQLTADSKGVTRFYDMQSALAICPTDGKWQIVMGLSFPDCWDGVYIDSPDHRSHVAFPSFTTLAGPGGMVCPISKMTGQRMKFMPVFRLFAGYTIMPGDDTSKWTLSSDAMDTTKPHGWSLHADYFEAWDPATKKEWTDQCIDRMMPLPPNISYSQPIPGFAPGTGPISCFGGNLGDGFTLNGAGMPPWGFGTPPNRLVPLNTIPQTP